MRQNDKMREKNCGILEKVENFQSHISNRSLLKKLKMTKTNKTVFFFLHSFHSDLTLI